MMMMIVVVGDDGNCVCLLHAREKLISIGCVVVLFFI